MRFRAFPKLPTALADASAASTDGDWIALEKIHGAQLVVGIDDSDAIFFGKRKAWLSDTDSFFGWQLVRHELARGVRSVKRELTRGNRVADGQDVVLYGELFGGAYPEVEGVRNVPALTPVQTGIAYAPDLRFAVFAILTAAADEHDGTLLSVTDTLRTADLAELITPPVVGRGSREELQRLPERYPSRVARAMGLPSVAGNTAEGFVAFRDKASSLASLFAYKRKIPEMREVTFDESVPFAPDQRRTVAELIELLPLVVNRARVESARSKVGADDHDAFLDELVLDVQIDMAEALPTSIRSLDAEALEELADAIKRLARLT